jgi:PAS domain S-box-containing protein
MARKRKSKSRVSSTPNHVINQGYGDLTELNPHGLILKSIGPNLLEIFADDYMELLGTSSAIYEINGDYAYGIFSSGWCRMMDSASRNLCDTEDNAEALASGQWLCHVSCWTDCSKRAIDECGPIDIACKGGLRIYAIPILAHGNVVGAINFGYGDPPTDPETLQKLSETYQLDYDDLVRESKTYDSRPSYIIDMARKRLNSTAQIIGSMIETKQTEEALRESEETLRTTLFSIGDAVISTDLKGSVVFLNPVAESLTGWNNKDAIGKSLENIFQIINEQSRESVQSPVTNVLESGDIVGLANHTLLIAKDGREIPIADSGAPIRNDNGETIGVVLVFRDQSKEHATRKALEESEATTRKKLKAITEPEGDIGELNLADIINSEELQAMMEDFNKVTNICGAILDVSGKILVRVNWQDICVNFHRVHPDSAKNCLECDIALAKGVPEGTFKAYRCKNNMWDMVSPIMVGEKHLGNIYLGQFFYEDEHVDYELFRKQARKYGFDEAKYIAALDRVPRLKRETVETIMMFYAKFASMISSLGYSKIKLSRDITNRKRAEKQTAKFHKLIRYVIEHTNSAVAVHDKDLRYLYVSQQYLKQFNISEQEVIGRHHYDVFPDLPQKWRDVHQRSLKGEVIKAERDCYYREDGSTLWTRWECRPWYEADGSIGGIIVYTEVINEQIDAEEKQLKLQEQLYQAQKMESVGRLAGGVAHDFNNMLSVILGRTEMALDQVDPGNPLYGNLEEIQKAAERSTDLTRQLLTFARKQTIAPKIIDLNEAVEGMLTMLRRLIGENINLAWLPSKKNTIIHSDPTQIDLILANLCVNARDAIDDVGKITIETNVFSFTEDYCEVYAGIQPGEYVLLAISDNGCGMGTETINHLFEPFFTTKGQGKGTGLGLSSVYGAVKQNNGFINVYSEPGEGTTFKIYLPQHKGSTSLQINTEHTKLYAKGSETVLLVEDEPSILRITTMMLEQLGYSIITAKAPDEAIRLAHEHHHSIDLLMTDVVMPEMNGRELAKNLLSDYPGIKCLFMSGYTADIIAHRGVLDEGVSFIQKPFSKVQLATKVREALGKE